MIRLEKVKYLKSEIAGYHALEPKGWKILMNSNAKTAVNTIIFTVLPFSYKYAGIFPFMLIASVTDPMQK
jgi:hypothetical protein